MENHPLSALQAVVTEQEIIESIREVVAFPSHHGIRGQETNVAEYIHALFTREGIASEIVPVTDDRCNVIAKIPGDGNGRTLLLTGHMDTVPPYGMPDPYEVKVSGDVLKGRGVVDMKGPLMCMVYSMIAIQRSGISLKGDLIFAGVIGEEENSPGTIDLIEKGIWADAAIVGEPTNLDVCVAHRGLEWFAFRFLGKTVHGGAQQDGVNAILMASNFIQRVEVKLKQKIKEQIHPLIGSSSMNYGVINGGTQPSTVAGDCVLMIDTRWVPGIRYEDFVEEYLDILDELSAEDPTFHCRMEVMESSAMKEGYVHEALETDVDHDVIKIIKAKAKEVTDNVPETTCFSAWSDAGLLSSYAHIPTILFAPGDIKTAHSSEEQLEIDQILPATYIYALSAIEFCNGQKEVG